MKPDGDDATIDDSRALARYHREEGAAAYAGKFERSMSRRRTDRSERALMTAMLADLDPRASLLNVACGAGRFSDILLASARHQVTYCDFSPAMLEEARRNLAAMGREDVAFVLKDAVNDRPPEPHDIVVNVRMLHHLKEADLRDRAFDFLCTAARDALVFTVASASTLKGWSRRLRSRSRQRGEYIASLAELRGALKVRGFTMEKVGYVSRLFSSQTWILARRSERGEGD